MKDPYLIAEIGSNWRKSDLEKSGLWFAKRQIEEAKEAGASAVKFQLFSAMELFGKAVRFTKFERTFNQWALKIDQVQELAEHAAKTEIEFLCSAFSVWGFDKVDKLVSFHKLASPEATSPLILNFLKHSSKPILYSNGCTDGLAAEILTDPARHFPMECVSKYPARLEDYNLDFRGKPLLWGLSDHTFGNELALTARANGCSFFEKHVDFFKYKGLKTPDYCVSSDKDQFKSWVTAIESYSPEKQKLLAKKSYARVEGRDGWHRPVPLDADLTLA